MQASTEHYVFRLFPPIGLVLLIYFLLSYSYQFRLQSIFSSLLIFILSRCLLANSLKAFNISELQFLYKIFINCPEKYLFQWQTDTTQVIRQEIGYTSVILESLVARVELTMDAWSCYSIVNLT